jgi:cell wall assembly regulator SMI1
MSSAARAWQQVEDIVRKVAPSNASALLARLPPGATTADFDALRNRFGVQPPTSLVEVYSIHDGLGVPAIRNGVLQPSALLALHDALTIRTELQRLAHSGHFDDMPTGWWLPTWLPISADGQGNHHCLDMAGGHVIRFWHDAGDRPKVAENATDYLVKHFDPIDWIEAE